MIRILMLITILFTLASCAATDADARSLLETAEFEGDEYGSIEITGDVSIGSNPFFNTTVHINYEKHKDAPVYENTP
tara:strand:+ start:2824 stop:3054 length:231 start_codon:yes stop_codon:yes gene_type:complete